MEKCASVYLLLGVCGRPSPTMLSDSIVKKKKRRKEKSALKESVNK